MGATLGHDKETGFMEMNQVGLIYRVIKTLLLDDGWQRENLLLLNQNLWLRIHMDKHLVVLLATVAWLEFCFIFQAIPVHTLPMK